MALRGPRDQDYVLETGAAVQDVREAARLTQDELAELVGVSKQTISNIERGYLDGVNVLRIRQIAAVCAGRGWLPKDADALADYILGSRDSLPIAMQRRSAPEFDGGRHLLPRSGNSEVPTPDHQVNRLRLVDVAA